MTALHGERRHLGVVVCMALLCSIGLAVLPSVAQAAETDTTLVSRADGLTGTKQNGNVGNTDISGNGRFLAFATNATNLDTADTDGAYDVYVRDRQTSETTLVSRATGATGVKSNGFSAAPSISDDGRFVAFTSSATNLDAADTNGVTDVYVRDLQTNTTALVSRADGPTGPAAFNPNIFFAGSEFPSISGDGNHVSFTTDASNFDPADVEEVGLLVRDVYVRSFPFGPTPTTVLVSRASGATGAKGDGESIDNAISADGRYVAFDSGATNLDPDQETFVGQVFLRDMVDDTTTLVSRADGDDGTDGNVGSLAPAISADGRFVTFTSAATNFDAAATSPDDYQIYRRDLQTDDTLLASRADGATGAPANGENGMVGSEVSDDGRYVAFAATATNLDGADSDSEFDVFIRDVLSNDTTLVSRASGVAGAKANGSSGLPDLSADGGEIAFTNAGTNLHADDMDTAYDLYLREPSPGATLVSLAVAKSGTGSGTVTSNPAGINCGPTCTTGVAMGSSVVLTAAPEAGSTFTAWTGCDSMVGNQCSVTVSSNRNVNARFTVNGGPGAAGRTISIAANKKKVAFGKKVKLSGQIDAGATTACESGWQVQLQKLVKPSSSYVGSGNAKADSLGRFKLKVKVTKNAKYRALVIGSVSCQAATSKPVKVKVEKP